MNFADRLLSGAISLGLALSLTIVPDAAAARGALGFGEEPSQTSQQPTNQPAPSDVDRRQLPDSPSSEVGGNDAQATGQPSSPQPGPQTSEHAPSKPAGAAAAAAPRITGVAASAPAGAAFAPAKQRRVRLLLIKVGAVAAAGAAIGTVVALSHASPSKPPGTR